MAKKNLNQATKKAQYLDKVEQAGKLGTDVDAFDLLLSGAEDACASFIQRVKENIEASDLSVNTGAIENINIKSEGDVILITGSKHLLYQDRGVSGTETKRDTVHYYSDKKPPMIVFKNLINLKNIQLKNNPAYYGEPSPFKHTDEAPDPDKASTSLAYAMREKIYKEGFEGHHYWSKELPSLIDDLKQNAKGFAIAKLMQNIDVKDSAKGLFPK